MLYLIRFGGEIATKARATRHHFQVQLARNLREALKAEEIPGRVKMSWSRFYVEAADPRAADVIGRVFGVQSYSPVDARPVTGLADVVAAGAELFRAEVAGSHFAVRARVAAGPDGRKPYHARDLERALGAALLPAAAGVNLSHPDVTASVEVRDGNSYYTTIVLPGPGGLPLKVQDHAVALVSGGFDSAVAAWMVLRRGVPLDYVLCDLGGATHRAGAQAVIDVIAQRWSYGTRVRLHVVDFSEIVLALEAVTPRYRQLVLKRAMLRTADTIGQHIDASGIVTGDAIGQVASQTLRNLRAMTGAAELPLLRPLLGMDKHDIIRWAEHIGTGALSAQVAEHCAIVPKHPATAADLDVVVAEESQLPAGLVATAVAERQVILLAGRGAAPTAVSHSPVEAEAIPAGAVVVDVRSRAAYDAWHFPGAQHLAYEAAAASLPTFAPGVPVVLYCTFGAKSAILAQALRRRGVDAWSFAGGSPALMATIVATPNPDPLLEAAVLGFAR